MRYPAVARWCFAACLTAMLLAVSAAVEANEPPLYPTYAIAVESVERDNGPVPAPGAATRVVDEPRRPSIPQLRFVAQEILDALGADPRVPSRKLCPYNDTLRVPSAHRIFVIVDRGKQEELAARLDIKPRKTDKPQAYAVRVKKTGDQTNYVVFGADAVGAMYGGLDVAEAIRTGRLADLKDGDHEPYIARRGIKFNIPLDARTPSYSDGGDAAQQNIPEMWSHDFWRSMLDAMARHRFNVLTLWNLHPFPSLVKVPEYPDVALDDVMRTTVKFDTTFQLTGRDMVRPEILANLETVKRMSIDEKIRFWREVMQHAHDRGIEVYLFTWNIFTWGAEGKYGITSAQDNPRTIDYFRCSVRETLATYPHLAGVGITAGENMQERKDEFGKEKWLWNAYGEAVRDVKKLQPERSIRMIHRYHQTNLDNILAEWKDYPDTFDLSFKYAIAHMYSSPAPPFAKKALAELPADRRMWMTVRNDDIYSFRWGDPEYARNFIKNLPGPDKLAGYYMGPDGYIWGREFLSTEPETPRQLVIDKQWYSFMLWGRLSYDPGIEDKYFQQVLNARFSQAHDNLYKATLAASKIIPLVTRFHWEDIDLKWFPEACISHPSHKGFHTVKHFMEGKTMPGAGILSIGEYLDRLAQGKSVDVRTEAYPMLVIAELHAHAHETQRRLVAIETQHSMTPRLDQNQKELRLWLNDLQAMAYLGEYYSDKIAAR